MIKKKKQANDKEESISLKENKEGIKKKRLKKITLQKINLGTKPIKISLSKDFIDYTNIGTQIKTGIKMISIIAVIAIVFIILLTLRGKFHYQNKNEISENTNLQSQTVNNNNTSSITSASGKINKGTLSSSSSLKNKDKASLSSSSTNKNKEKASLSSSSSMKNDNKNKASISSSSSLKPSLSSSTKKKI